MDREFSSEIWACEAEWQDCEDRIEDEPDTSRRNAKFTSVWDDGILFTTDCKVDTTARRVFDIEPSADMAEEVNVLDREYVTIDGIDYPVVRKDELTPEKKAAGYYWYE